MLYYSMLSNSRCNHGLDVALKGRKMNVKDRFFTAVAVEHSGTQLVVKEFSETLSTSVALTAW